MLVHGDHTQMLDGKEKTQHSEEPKSLLLQPWDPEETKHVTDLPTPTESKPKRAQRVQTKPFDIIEKPTEYNKPKVED